MLLEQFILSHSDFTRILTDLNDTPHKKHILDRQVYAWGRNVEGQLGLGDTKMRRMPSVVDALWALPVQQLAAGEKHSAALTSNGSLFTWGSNACGQLGLPAVAEVAAQTQVNPNPHMHSPYILYILSHHSPGVAT